MTGRAQSRVMAILAGPGTAAASLSAAGMLLLLVACGPEHAAVAQGTADAGRAVATLPPSGADAAAAPAPALPEEVAEGIRLYHAQYCGTCHTNALAGTAGTFGPTHDGLRDTAAKRIHHSGYTGKATTAEEYVRESIREPGAYRVPGFEHTRFLMPAYTPLTDAEVDALVRMLLWQPPSEEERP